MNGKSVVRVHDVMNDRYIRADGMETVRVVFLRLARADARCMVVERRDEHEGYGTVLLSDIARKIIAADRSPERANVCEIMSRPALSVPPDKNIRYAARLFDRFGIFVAPVVDGDEVPGIVTNTDIVLRGLARAIEI